MNQEQLRKVKLFTQIAITAVLLPTAVFFLITKPDDSAMQKWAIGIVSFILGYWLK
jgi:hypothetical protein